jgi:hypothetical protein
MKKISTADTTDKNQEPEQQKKVPAKKTTAAHEPDESEKAPVSRRFEKGYIVETPD